MWHSLMFLGARFCGSRRLAEPTAGAMSPKKSGKAKAKAKASSGLAPGNAAAAPEGGQSVSGPGPEGTEDIPTHQGNVDYLARLQIAWETVTSHPIFQDVVDMTPYEIEARYSVCVCVCEEVEIDVLQLIRLSLNFFNEFGKVKFPMHFHGQATGDGEKSGFQATYDTAAFKTAMANTKQYAAAGNFAWCKVGFTTSPGVPYNESAVEKLKSFYFGEILAPKRYPEVMVVAVSAKQLDEGMMNSRGAMECLTPCELQHALVFRVAELITQKSTVGGCE